MKDLLQRAKNEIVQLRRSNEILSAQVEVVHIFAAALGIRGINSGQSVDVALGTATRDRQVGDDISS